MCSSNFETHCSDTSNEPSEDKYEIRLTPELVANPVFQRQIRDIIFTLIPQVPRLANLYMTWQSLMKEDKRFIDEYTKSNTTGIELYKPLLDALRKWDKMQDTQGAPGSEPGLVNFSGLPQIESGISDVLCLVETLICRLINNNGDSDLGETSRLSTSLRSVYDEDRDRGDIEVIYQQTHIRKSISLDSLPSLLNKKTSVFSI